MLGSTSFTNLVYEFNRTACASINDRNNSQKARDMLDAGFTITRLRCNDFFAERAGHQTQARFWRGTVAPISAVLSGVISLWNFTDEERSDAIQILGITESASVAGFELYEREFLFDTENVNAVRRLVMRALDFHARQTAANGVPGFQLAVRHLIDNQMICTPANILELVRTSIAEGEVRAFEGAPVRQRGALGGGAAESAAIAAAAAAFSVAELSADQVGSLWWLKEGNPNSTERQIIRARLGDLADKVFDPDTTTVRTGRDRELQALVDGLSPSTKTRFRLTLQDIRSAIGGRATLEAALDAASEIEFTTRDPVPGAVDVGPDGSD